MNHPPPAALAPGAPIALPNSLPAYLLLPILLCLLVIALPLFVDIERFRMPEEIPGWALLFGLPHIIASFQTMVDRDYIRAYRYRSVFTASLLVLPLILVTMGFPTLPITVAYIALTIYHTVAQQMGIGLAVAGMRPTNAARALKWSAVSFGLLAYANYFVGDSLKDHDRAVLQALCEAGKLPFGLLIAGTGAYIAWQARSDFCATTLLTANTAIFLIVPLLLLETRFGILGLMIIRMVHDLSGYVVYVAHDLCRNRERPRNALYKCFPYCKVWWLAPALSIVIAYAINELPGLVGFGKWLLIGCYLAHYYMEGFIWRGRTPHRAQVSFR